MREQIEERFSDDATPDDQTDRTVPGARPVAAGPDFGVRFPCPAGPDARQGSAVGHAGQL